MAGYGSGTLFPVMSACRHLSHQIQLTSNSPVQPCKKCAAGVSNRKEKGREGCTGPSPSLYPEMHLCHLRVGKVSAKKEGSWHTGECMAHSLAEKQGSTFPKTTPWNTRCSVDRKGAALPPSSLSPVLRDSQCTSEC